MKKLFLVDVSSLFFRAFYAVRPLTSPSGLPTNAIYGFLSMLIRLLKEEKPEYLVFCYDRPEPSFRKDIYPEYKANRTEMPEDLIPQIPYIKKLAEVLGIPSVEMLGFEADDLIGTLTCLGQKHKMEVFIVSGDKDFGQLIKAHTYIYDTMKNVKIDSQGVIDKWGVPAEHFIDYLALIGDSSDNIPGVSGIGPKGAQKLLLEYGSLEKIYDDVENIKGALKDKLIKGKENAFLSRELATINCRVPIGDHVEEYRRKPFLRDDVKALLDELNFKTVEKNIWPLDISEGAEAGKSVSESSQEKISEPVETVTPVPSVQRDRPPVVEIDISDLRGKLKAKEILWGFLSDRGVFVAQEQDALFGLRGDPLELGRISDEMQVTWRGFDLKSFWHVIKPQDPKLDWDSLLAAYVLKPGESMEWDRVYARYTGELPMEMPDGADLLMANLHLEKELRRALQEVNSEAIYRDLDLPLAPLLYKMEQRGIAIDRQLLLQQSAELGEEIRHLEKEIQTQAGEEFNVASPKQLSHVLFEKMKLPVGRKTKTGFSTDNEVLEKLKKTHPIANAILDYRELAKLKSTYVDVLPQLVKEDGRIHSHFNQALTTTGRLSSNDPNLQNIPIRTPRGARVRKAFIAENKNLLLSVDYSQIELRILAHFSEDENMCRAFVDDLDIHAATAAEVFGVSLKEVSGEQRRTAKAVNFGIAYGQGAFGLAENLGISRSEAADIIKRYFSRFPRVQNYIEDTIVLAKEKGYVSTLAGRRRYMDELKSKSVAIQKFGERAAINAPIQGTASDIVRQAMIAVDHQFELPIILQVHDELIFEGSRDLIESERGKIVQCMESITKLRVPLKANSAVGPTWDAAK
ncbi:MAG: DNA polymerase I [Bdellovibrio sp. CG10_big_fil_rev_8_21_14_0_10_47_8]|nr:MAG: DNA polymerase I [Bdellovibrio sp. CG10_big_fil_rev_8_21_14_0_10_47_8]